MPNHDFYKIVHDMLCPRQPMSKEVKVKLCVTNFRVVIFETSLEDKVTY